MAVTSPFKVIANDNYAPAPSAPKLRFSRIQDLKTGEVVGLDAQTDSTFEENALFGFASGTQTPDAAKWLGELVERVGREMSDTRLQNRPITISAPLSALSHPDAPMAAEAGARRANICTQEIRIEFPDAALYEAEDIAPAYIESFFNRGFRVGIDARMSWRSPFTAYMGTVIEAVRLTKTVAEDLGLHSDRLDAAYGSGAMIYVQDASWQDAEKLSDIGVCYAVSPKLDA